MATGIVEQPRDTAGAACFSVVLVMDRGGAKRGSIFILSYFNYFPIFSLCPCCLGSAALLARSDGSDQIHYEQKILRRCNFGKGEISSL